MVKSKLAAGQAQLMYDTNLISIPQHGTSWTTQYGTSWTDVQTVRLTRLKKSN